MNEGGKARAGAVKTCISDSAQRKVTGVSKILPEWIGNDCEVTGTRCATTEAGGEQTGGVS